MMTARPERHCYHCHDDFLRRHQAGAVEERYCEECGCRWTLDWILYERGPTCGNRERG
jgi:hypothetical protein